MRRALKSRRQRERIQTEKHVCPKKIQCAARWRTQVVVVADHPWQVAVQGRQAVQVYGQVVYRGRWHRGRQAVVAVAGRGGVAGEAVCGRQVVGSAVLWQVVVAGSAAGSAW